jgi:type IV secretion system protein VirB9
MTRALLAAVIMAALLNSPAKAEQAPRSAGFDARVQHVVYNPLNVVRVVGSPTNSTQIIFSAKEEITQISVGDEAAWLPQPVGNLLFIKPVAMKASTNMQVVTKRPDGTNRSYQFRLVAASRGAIFSVSFNYPDDEEKVRTDLAVAQAALVKEKETMAHLQNAWAEGPRNWRYVAQGSSSIEPTEVSDNGRQTAFRFPSNMRVPTIYAAAPDGTETIVPYTMANDVAVVQTAASLFTLRDGKEVLRIFNHGFDPVGRNPATGTGSPELNRKVRSLGL